VRSIFAATLVTGACVVWSGACASVEGLSQYSTVSGDGSVTVVQDVGPQGDDAMEDAAQGQDASGGDDVIADPPDGSDINDVAAPPMDASRSDAAPPACNSTTCNGCCTNGVCSGGNSVTTCGRHGAQCSNCTNLGGACNSGVCGSKPADSGTTTSGQCTSQSVSSCGPCSGTAIYNTCCKSDHTCGCQFTVFAPCT
jgi:hypothetical protein